MDTILYPIQVAVAWIMVTIHKGLVALPAFDDGAGPAWVLSIVGLTIVIRLLIMPLFFRQIRASRGMQLMQPELQALQKKYKGKTDPVSRQAQQQEMMALYKKHNANPFSSCLPILLQMPIFFALFRVLNGVGSLALTGEFNGHSSIGPLTQGMAADINASTVFGAGLSETFIGSDNIQVKIVAAVLVIVMSGSQFFSMKQLAMKNMPASSMDNPIMRQQKLMMYVFPVIFAVSGVAFPLGVLIYWTVSNFWAVGQQAYTVRRQPAPGSEAYKAKQERDAKKRAKKGLPPIEDDPAKPEEIASTGQRVQPVGKNRAKKKGIQGGVLPADGTADSEEEKKDDAKAAEADDDETAEDDGPVRGKDGLTDEERARKRYEARAAERRAAREKRAAAERRRRENQSKGKYNKD